MKRLLAACLVVVPFAFLAGCGAGGVDDGTLRAADRHVPARWNEASWDGNTWE